MYPKQDRLPNGGAPVKKIKTLFFCQNCGQQSPKWLGKCPSCGEWNRFVEEEVREIFETQGIPGLTRLAAEDPDVDALYVRKSPSALEVSP